MVTKWLFMPGVCWLEQVCGISPYALARFIIDGAVIVALAFYAALFAAGDMARFYIMLAAAPLLVLVFMATALRYSALDRQRQRGCTGAKEPDAWSAHTRMGLLATALCLAPLETGWVLRQIADPAPLATRLFAGMIWAITLSALVSACGAWPPRRLRRSAAAWQPATGLS